VTEDLPDPGDGFAFLVTVFPGYSSLGLVEPGIV